jgi:hypothetical protein
MKELRHTNHVDLMILHRGRLLAFVIPAVALMACRTSTDDGRDYSQAVVRGVVRTSAGVPAPDVNVRAQAFVACGGNVYGEDVGLPRPRTDATGAYSLIVQSLATPQPACVIVTGTSATGATVQSTLPNVDFRSSRGGAIDTVTADLVLP